MPAPRRAPSTGKPKLCHKSELQVIVAAGELGETPSAFLERSVAKELAVARHTLKVAKLEAGEADARRTLKPAPSPADYGLPPDYRVPAGPR